MLPTNWRVRGGARVREPSRRADRDRTVDDHVLRLELLHVEIDGLDERVRVWDADVKPFILSFGREATFRRVMYHNLVTLPENFLKRPADLTVAYD